MAELGFEPRPCWSRARRFNYSTMLPTMLVAMAKGRAYDNLYARLETKKGEKELYRLARQRDRAGKDVQHVKVIKDENGNVMVNSKAVLKRWKEYFEKLMNEENNRDPRTEEPEVVPLVHGPVQLKSPVQHGPVKIASVKIGLR